MNESTMKHVVCLRMVSAMEKNQGKKDKECWARGTYFTLCG